MMKNRSLRIILSLLISALLIGFSLTGAAAAGSASHSQSDAEYTNPETGFQVLIVDELDLIDSEEEASLVKDMEPITKYGHAILWTTEEYAGDEIDQARTMRRDLYEYDSACIFAINMNIRKITIQSYGTIDKAVSASTARSITDNVKYYATNRNYYSCAKNAYEQIFSVLEGERIAEPMKIVSYAVIAVMLGVIITLCVAFSQRCNPLRRPYRLAQVTGEGMVVSSPIGATLIKRETIHVSSGGGGGGGCGGGGGGGGCGGGGSSSF